jgi:hypothetical protein
MNSTRLARISTYVTTAAWTAKALAIGLAGGLGQSPLESPLFLLGLVALVVAAASTGIAVLRDGPWWRRVAGAVLGLVLTAVVGTVAGVVVSAIEPTSPGWAWEEANLWAMMATLLAVNLALGRRRPEQSATRVAAAAPVEA